MNYCFHGKSMALGVYTMCHRQAKNELKSLSVRQTQARWIRHLSTVPSPKHIIKTPKKKRFILSMEKGDAQSRFQTKLVDENGEIQAKLSSLEPPIMHASSRKKVFDMKPSMFDKYHNDVNSSRVILDTSELIEALSPNTHIGRSKIDPSQSLETANKSSQETQQSTMIVSPKNGYEQKINWSLVPSYYASLSKTRLTGLVVLTSMGGYMMAPVAFDPALFFLVSAGTGLTSCAANTFNQVLEVPYDSQMNRTRNRVLVKGLITPLHATMFGLVSGSLGVGMLYCGVNELTAAIGLMNIILYAGAYTPLKRLSIANTWVGAIVGALPPIMGWTACTGTLSPEALLLGAILFAWQFPHFNALSWNLRPDYSKAGYRMMSVTNPDLCKRTSLTYSLLTVPICTLCSLSGLTSWEFGLDSLPVNGYLIYLAWKFYKEGDSNNSQRLFKYSLVHLPLIMMLMIMSRKEST